MPLQGSDPDGEAGKLPQDLPCAALRDAAGPAMMVSNEIGSMGATPLGREVGRCLDALGALHRAVAACCARAAEGGRHRNARSRTSRPAPHTTRPALALLPLLMLLLGQPTQAQVSVRDDRGAVHRFTASPQRIVSLLPSITESVCALGACARLVGVDRYSNAPAQVRALPKLGGLDDAQVERIVALKPDVVLAGASARVTDRLESLGLTVVLLESNTHADVQRSLGLIATLLGTPSEADRVWQGIQHDLATAAARVPPALRGKRVYFEVASTPYAAGTVSFIGQTLVRLGLGNVVPAELGPFPELNPEFVVRSRPDIVMAARREVQAMPGRPGWQGLEALQQGRSCAFEPARYEVLIRPGPRMGEAALLIADCLASLPSAPGR